MVNEVFSVEFLLVSTWLFLITMEVHKCRKVLEDIRDAKVVRMIDEVLDGDADAYIEEYKEDYYYSDQYENAQYLGLEGYCSYGERE